jgi:cytochrome P450
VNQSSKGAPLVAIMHDQQMISLGDEIVRDKGMVMHYGDQWRTFRRLVHQHLMETMVETHHTQIVNAADGCRCHSCDRGLLSPVGDR